MGGVERMVLNLVAAIAATGQAVDLLTIKAEGLDPERLPNGVRWRPLGTRHALTSIPVLAGYLRREKPAALLVAKDRAGRAALLARRLAGVDLPVVIRLGTNLSAALAGKPGWQRWLRLAPMRWFYAMADGVVAVSEGVAADVRLTTGLSDQLVHVVRNPVITPSLAAEAAAPCPHPWLAPGHEVPVVMGIGRLTEQKDFLSLVRAFAQLTMSVPARLIVLGEGGQRAMLEQEARRLGVSGVVAMPGFQPSPYPWLARADLFVLSSRWEGSPNALTEALALGIPAVSTDCPSGPRELLAGGQFGPLTPVGDPVALAEAMAAVLRAPIPAEQLRRAVAEYRAERCAGRYLELLGVGAHR